MTQKYCKHLFNGITFQAKGITTCNTLWNTDFSHIPYDSKCIENYVDKRNQLLNLMKQGKNIDYCNNCLYLKEIDDDIEINKKITNIDINYWNECNCACYYCANRSFTKLRITDKKVKGQINFLKFLKALKKYGLLDDKLALHSMGGEPALLKEFPDILKFVLKHKYPMTILSNGIIYEKYISKVLHAISEVSIQFSLDAGTRETYRKIKRVDKFDQVLDNVKRYIKETGETNSHNIIMKYIILKGINDNKEEIDKWLEKCISIGVTNFFPSIEFCNSVYNSNSKNNSITPNIVELYNYIKTRVKEINPNFSLCQYDFLEERLLKYQTYNLR